MDLTKFNNPSFDVKDWINSAFRSSEAQSIDKKEQYASVLVTKLQFLIKEANRALAARFDNRNLKYFYCPNSKSLFSEKRKIFFNSEE